RAKPSAVARVLVLADGGKPEVRQRLAELEPWLSDRVAVLSVERAAREYTRRKPGSPDDDPIARHTHEHPDLVVVLGGDGAILGAVRAFAASPVPTIGINFGRVGFLASAETSRWREALSEILEGRAVVEPRMRLQAELRTSSSREDPARKAEVIRAVALNDV